MASTDPTYVRFGICLKFHSFFLGPYWQLEEYSALLEGGVCRGVTEEPGHGHWTAVPASASP